MVHLVLLSGGSGSRLWPLSNNARSKQFLKVLRNDTGQPVSMVQRVFEQLQKLDLNTDITIGTCSSQEYSIESQIEGEYSLVVEPERRDTAPAIMLACKHLFSVQGADESDTVIVMPIDTFAEQAYFEKLITIDEAVQSDFAEIVLLGVEPTYLSEKYGYIIPGKTFAGDRALVDSFKEKPGKEEAEKYIEKGALWNCGLFGFKLGYMNSLSDRYYKTDSFEDFYTHYSELPKNSFDYEVVEKADSVGVVRYSGAWKDLGTWNTLTEEMSDFGSGRHLGIETCNNTHIINELGIPLIALGVHDAVIIATPDGILVSDKKESSFMKPYVSAIKDTRPMYEQRRWGEYRVVDNSVFPDGAKSLTKELVIKSGKQLSYQRHQRRSEVWTVVSGSGQIVIDDKVSELKSGSVVNIEAGKKHSCRALDSDLHVIEVQLGDVLVEEDIERFGNYWEE